jgi:hypothetical protein
VQNEIDEEKEKNEATKYVQALSGETGQVLNRTSTPKPQEKFQLQIRKPAPEK